MKKLFSTFLLFMLALILLNISVTAFALEKEEPSDILKVDAKSSVLMDFNSGEVLFKQDENKKGTIASMCKIMTLLLVFEEIDNGKMTLDEEIPISSLAGSMGGSQAFLNIGDSYKASELIKSIVVGSANDSAVAMAERVGGSVENFVKMMNKKAEELGMKNTRFSNPTGLPKPDQFSTAFDVALMTRELLKHKDYYKFSKIWLDEIVHKDGRKTTITNTNKLIRFFNGCDGGKTGFTNEAGHCLSCTAARSGMRLISVIIGSSSSKQRFKDTSTLLNYGFNNYENKCIVDESKTLENAIKVSGGKADSVMAKPSSSFYILSKKGEEKTGEFLLTEKYLPLKAPIKKGDKIGTMYVTKNGVVVKEIDLEAVSDVEKSSFTDYYKKFIEKWKLIG